MKLISAQERESHLSQLCEGTLYSFSGWHGPYIGVKSLTIMNCEKHGNWKAKLQNVLSGRRCPICAREYTGFRNKKDLAHFLKKAKEIHGDKYDYSLTIYVKTDLDVQIICKKHGVFTQKPEKHLSGRGCPKCGAESRDDFKKDDLDSFIRKALHLHGDKFDYSKTVYEKSSKKVTIGCSVHGFFEQSPNDHLSSKGCPACAVYGFKSSKNATIYALRSDCGQYVKIGITNNFKQRFHALKRQTPFDVFVIERIECDGQTASQLEKMFHREFESAGFTGFDGATEWLRWSAEIQHWLRLLKC